MGETELITYQLQGWQMLACLLDAPTRFPSRCAARKLFCSSWGQLAEKTARHYEAMANLVNQAKTRKIHQLCVPGNPPWEPHAESSELFRQLKVIWTASLSGHLRGFYVHGSLGSGDLTAYSDCDTLAIVDCQTLHDPDKLLALRKGLQEVRHTIKQFDPDQHHGNFILTEYDLLAYPQSFLPIAALAAGWGVHGDSSLTFKLRECQAEAISSAKNMATRLKKMSLPHTVSELKSNLSYIMLLPALWLGAKGTFVYKRESFALARADFSPEAWRAVEIATVLRRDWRPVRPCWQLLQLEYQLYPNAAQYFEKLQTRVFKLLRCDTPRIDWEVLGGASSFIASVRKFGAEVFEKLERIGYVDGSNSAN